MLPNAVDRQEIGRWLAGLLLAEMDTASLDFYRSAKGQQILDTLDQLPTLSGLVDALRAQSGEIEAVRLDLATAYGQTFLVGGAQSVPLHASTYLSDRGLLMQAPVRDTEAILHTLGLSVPPGFCEPADHIGVQLSILAEMAGSEWPDAPSESEYLDTRLLPWVPTFAALCSQVSPVPLYRELGTATLGWLRLLEAGFAAEKQQG